MKPFPNEEHQQDLNAAYRLKMNTDTEEKQKCSREKIIVVYFLEIAHHYNKTVLSFFLKRY